jgi:hypothetical protein
VEVEVKVWDRFQAQLRVVVVAEEEEEVVVVVVVVVVVAEVMTWDHC